MLRMGRPSVEESRRPRDDRRPLQSLVLVMTGLAVRVLVVVVERRRALEARP